jgi:acyl carrier protein
VTARRLLLESNPSSAPFLNDLDDDASLLDAGIDSAQLVELSLLLEERLGRPLAVAELDRLTTLSAIEDLLAEAAR